MRRKPGQQGKGGLRPRAPAAAPEPARARRGRRALFVPLGVALVLAAAYAGIAQLRREPPRVAPPAPGSGDPAARMSTVEAAGMAARLYRENRSYESLPYFRRVAPEFPPGRLDFHLLFASALQNGSVQARIRSEERVRLMLECLDELARAERAAQSPRNRARAIVARAFSLRIWGFTADAVAELRRALATDPSYPNLPENVRLMERRMREPRLPDQAFQGPGLAY